MALLIRADGTQETIKPIGGNGRLTGAQVRKAIGATMLQHVDVDPAYAEGNVSMWMDEEGKLFGKPCNAQATKLSTYTMPGDVLVGDVLLCGAAEDLE